MRLRECLGAGQLLQGDPDVEIQRVVYDSRQAGPGALFVAIPGFTTDGHLYVGDAVARGAAAVVVERPVRVPRDVPVVQVSSSRRALGALAAQLYRCPSRHLQVIGVTGTNGKTTTAHLIRSILMGCGHKVGLVGTVQNYVADEALPATLTTPQASDVQELLHRMVLAGCRYAVMEVSSEGLDMNRVDDVEFDIGVFTNLTQDHLNYHRTWERYRDAKRVLFRRLGQGGVKRSKVAVLNGDDPSADLFRAACSVPVMTYGLNPGSQVWAHGVDVTSSGSRFSLRTPEGEVPLALRLAGRFNVYNALAAAAAARAAGVDLPGIKRALEAAKGVAGRMEPVNAGQPFGVFVDYAHSPDGLENVLGAARAFARGRLIAVFGCGGDRDRSKRAPMGRIAGKLADYVIITSDNPRSEDPIRIVQDIEAGVRQTLRDAPAYEVVLDRAQAIERAVSLAAPDDVIIIAGKGHETHQILGDKTIDFDDRLVARAVVQARLKRKEGA